MRTTFLVVISILSILLMSCDNNFDTITQPGDSVGSTLNKITDFDYYLLPLPEKSHLFEDSLYSITKTIDGIAGGSISYSNYFISVDGDSVSFEFDIDFPKNAFSGTEEITVTLDDEYAALKFYPHLVFNADHWVKLTQKFRGLNLDGMSNQTIDFVFIGDDGNIELVAKNGVQVIIPRGLVRVNNAILRHFSRYGWIRKPTAPVIYDMHNCD